MVAIPVIVSGKRVSKYSRIGWAILGVMLLGFLILIAVPRQRSLARQDESDYLRDMTGQLPDKEANKNDQGDEFSYIQLHYGTGYDFDDERSGEEIRQIVFKPQKIRIVFFSTGPGRWRIINYLDEVTDTGIDTDEAQRRLAGLMK